MTRIKLTCLALTLAFASASYADEPLEDIAFVHELEAVRGNKKKKKRQKRSKKESPESGEAGEAGEAGEVGEGAESSAPTALFIKLHTYQMRALKKKNKLQNKKGRYDPAARDQLAPIELNSQQKLAIRKALKIKKPLPKRVYLWVDFDNTKTLKERGSARFIVRPVDQFRRKNPSDASPR